MRDFDNPGTGGDHQQDATFADDERRSSKVEFLKLAWDAIGSEFGSRHTQYEMFYAGARSSPAATASAPTTGSNATGLVEQLLLSVRSAASN